MRPKPIAEKKLGGTYRPDRAKGAIEERFKPLTRMPKPPSELNDLAVEIWYDVGKQLLNAELFKAIDMVSFAMFCAEVGKWREAEQHIKDEGLTYIPPRGRLPKMSPWVNVSSMAFEKIRRFFGEFGLTPAERSRIKFTDAKEPDSLADKLFEMTHDAEVKDKVSQ